MPKEWPEEWKGGFDFVHQRNAIANTGVWEGAVETVRKLVDLAKPGGYIQIVDRYMPTGKQIEARDQPSMNLFKTLGLFLKRVGLAPDMSPELGRMLKEAGGEKIMDLGFKTRTSKIGKGCDPELWETIFVQMRGLSAAMRIALEKMEELPFPLNQWEELN